MKIRITDASEIWIELGSVHKIKVFNFLYIQICSERYDKLKINVTVIIAVTNILCLVLHEKPGCKTKPKFP